MGGEGAGRGCASVWETLWDWRRNGWVEFVRIGDLFTARSCSEARGHVIGWMGWGLANSVFGSRETSCVDGIVDSIQYS